MISFWNDEMSLFLEQIQEVCKTRPDALAFRNSAGESLTYQQLDARSDALASYLHARYSRGIPVAFRGHKQKDMLVVMLACMKAGFSYVPLDSSLPVARVENILGQLSNPILLEVEEGSCSGLGCDSNLEYGYVEANELQKILSGRVKFLPSSSALQGTEVHYILFTSGSTGNPKGVIQPARSIDATFRYFQHFIPEGDNLVMFNRAHYSFDLSLFDLVMALPHGHTLYALDETTEQSLAKTFEALTAADVAVWVSTPSFLNLCMADPSFNSELLPSLRSFVLCGETLHCSTAQEALKRFPCARLYNSYGPTEAQGAITDIEVTPGLLRECSALPVGKCSPYNELQIVDIQTKEVLPQGQLGEICIIGDTIATGYYGQPDLTSRAFSQRMDSHGNLRPAYYTGDKGYLDKEDVLWFLGRYDFQVKVNGFRIELQEIEEALNSCDAILESCVVVEQKTQLSQYLVAHVALNENYEAGRHQTNALKAALRDKLPSYMIPRMFKYHDELPKTLNGKIDRKQLQSLHAIQGAR